MSTESKIIASLPRDGENVVISNYYGDEPSQKMRDFCGTAVMRAVEELQKELLEPGNTRRGKKIFFQRGDGRCYHIYCGHNMSRTRPGQFLYNVYIHPCGVGRGSRSGK